MHRAAPRVRKLSQHPAPARRLRDHRRRRRAPRLRLSVGERPLRRDPRRAPDHLHRPDVGTHPHHGRQDRSQGDRQAARHSGRAGFRWRGEQRDRGDEGRQGDGLSRADQGDRRRRRTRHEGRAIGRRPRHGPLHCARRSQGRLRQRPSLHGEVSHQAAPHRDPGARRRSGQCGASRRARLLLAAAPSEDPRGVPVAGTQRRRTPEDRRDGGGGHAQDQVPRRRHGGVPVRGRRVLFHRDEHAPAGGASGHRGGYRYRPRARADPRRLRRPALVQAAGHHLPRPRHRVPHQRREPAHLPPLAGTDHLLASARAASAYASTAASTRAIASPPTTTASSASSSSTARRATNA